MNCNKPEIAELNVFVDAVTKKDYIAILLFLREFNPSVALEQIRAVMNNPKELESALTNLIKADYIEIHNVNKYRLTPYGRNAIDRLFAIRNKEL